MPTHRRSIAGFTLFELLATIVIIGIIVSMAFLAIGDNQGERERRAAQQLSTLIALAQEQALFDGLELGLDFTEEGYGFYQLSEGKWQEISEDPQLKPRQFPDEMRVTLYLDGLRVNLPKRKEVKVRDRQRDKDKDDDKSKGEEVTPHVLILSDGTVTPFEVLIGDGYETDVKLAADPLGRTEIEVEET